MMMMIIMMMDNYKLLVLPVVPVGNIADCNCCVSRPLFGRIAAAVVAVDIRNIAGPNSALAIAAAAVAPAAVVGGRTVAVGYNNIVPAEQYAYVIIILAVAVLVHVFVPVRRYWCRRRH